MKARIGAKSYFNENATSKFHFTKLKRSDSSNASTSAMTEDDNSLEDIEVTPTFHNENRKILLFSTKPRYGKGFKAPEILDIIYKDQPGEVKCTLQPTKVQYNSAFLFDVRIIPLDDLPADGNGQFVNNRRVTHTYTRHSNGKWKREGDVHFTLQTANDYHLTREYKKKEDFHQIISYVNDINGDIVNNVVLLEYTFTGKEHVLAPTFHGNAERKKVFTKTKPSV